MKCITLSMGRPELYLTSSVDFSNRILMPSECEKSVYYLSFTANKLKTTHRINFYCV